MRRIAREQARAQRQRQREIAQKKREEAKAYAWSRADQAENGTAEIKRQEEEINFLLVNALSEHQAFDFETTKRPFDHTPFEATAQAPFAPDKEAFEVTKPSLFVRVLPWSGMQFRRKQAKAAISYQQALTAYNDDLCRYENSKGLYLAKQKDVNHTAADHNLSVDTFRNNVLQGDHEAIVTFYNDICNDDFQKECDATSAEIGFSVVSRHLVVDLELPAIDVIPEETAFKYVRSADRIDKQMRPAAKRKTMYGHLIAQIVLKCLSRVFSALDRQILNCVTLNAMLDGIDPATGNDVRVCLVSVSMTQDSFDQLNLSQVQPEQCLKMLKASVSRAPAEMAPVKPLVELDMVDPRFIPTSDVMSSIDSRPNLMDLTPGEFEGLITNLFTAMGLETRQTRASRDGGVDCVAFDQRPIFGGKVVIQAKRYKGTVGVSAVRDLFGTVQNEGASKGILVTTSGYGKASFDFARGKPLELLDGGNLLHLLMEHANIEAKIVAPDEWKDSYLQVD